MLAFCDKLPLNLTFIKIQVPRKKTAKPHQSGISERHDIADGGSLAPSLEIVDDGWAADRGRNRDILLVTFDLNSAPESKFSSRKIKSFGQVIPNDRIWFIGIKVLLIFSKFDLFFEANCLLSPIPVDYVDLEKRRFKRLSGRVSERKLKISGSFWNDLQLQNGIFDGELWTQELSRM